MAKYRTVWRIQPKGKPLPKYSRDSLGNRTDVFVFDSKPSESYIKREWLPSYYQGMELVAIRVNKDDLSNSEDYEGSLLASGKGTIIKRIPWDKSREWFGASSKSVTKRGTPRVNQRIPRITPRFQKLR